MSGGVSPARISPAGTSTTEIGYYVHHHGRGHTNRARQIVAHLNRPVTVFSSSPHVEAPWTGKHVLVVSLPPDTMTGQPAAQDWPDVLHYAPLGVPGIRERMFRLAQWAAVSGPRLLVVDVSVEVTLFARLLGVPTIVMRQSGLRTDLPHLAAYRSSNGLLAPYVAALEEPDMPDWIRHKTYYAGGFSRYAGRWLSRNEARQQLKMPNQPPAVVVMSGWGGRGNPLEAIALAARACPGWQWWVVGPIPARVDQLPTNMILVGAVADTFPYLVAANVVIGSAGNNTVMEVATAGTPYVSIPEERPFDEQRRKAEAIARTGGALVLPDWPAPERWSGLLLQAQALDTKVLTEIVDEEGAKKAASYVEQVAKEYDINS